MRRVFIIIAIVGLTAIGARSQELGVRFGDAPGGNVAVDAIFSLGDFSRLHGDASFGNRGLGVDLLWDFLYKPFASQDNAYWYVGTGPSLRIDDPFWLGASGEIGLEYRFDAPISISADWRPTIWVIDKAQFSARGWGVNVRYIFGR